MAPTFRVAMKSRTSSQTRSLARRFLVPGMPPGKTMRSQAEKS